MEKFGLDEYTSNLLIDYFKNNREIKYVRVIGSRVKGISRLASDIDFLIEGTFENSKLTQFVDEINLLKHPYRVDLINIKDPEVEPFVKRTYHTSEYFYKFTDYYMDEKYEEFKRVKENNDFRPNWQRRYESRLQDKYELFMTDLQIYNDHILPQAEDIAFQKNIFVLFKGLFEAVWRITKDYLKECYCIVALVPREVLTKAYEQGIIKNLNIWMDMIYDFNVMTDESFISVKDELFYRLNEIYLPEITNQKVYFQEKYIGCCED